MLAELVGYRELVIRRTAVCGALGNHVEQKRAAVGGTPAACVPVHVGNGRKTRIFGMQARQRSVDGLFFRADEADGNLPFLQGKHLRTQHGRVCDAEELKSHFIEVACDDEKPRPVGRRMDLRCLQLTVYPLFFAAGGRSRAPLWEPAIR